MIKIIDHCSDYITFSYEGKEYDIVSYDYEHIDYLIWSELPEKKLLDYRYVRGDETETFDIEWDMICEYPELIKYWILSKKDLWISINTEKHEE